VIVTERLLLRPWREADRDPFAAMNADPEVMRYFPTPLDRLQSDSCIDLFTDHIEAEGFGFWALEHVETAAFLGVVGLQWLMWDNPIQPGVEIGWRLGRPAWGHGFAAEAAKACLAYGFGALALRQIVSFTAVGNARSEAVMRRIGMRRRPDLDFEHPAMSLGSPLRPQIVYSIEA
jgi:RimJ/RimL family protein N-acetyltransferase